MGQNETVAMADLAALIEGHRSVVARMALVGADDGWLLHHGEITLDADAAPQERTWHYDGAAAFLECRIPAPLVAALLLRAEPQTIAGFDVRVPEGQATSAAHNRYEGNREWNRVTTPWPRSEWTVPRPNYTDHNHTGVLVGNADAPSFLNFDAALSTFFYQAPHNSAAGRPDLWRVVQPHREAWLRRTTITPDTMAVLVEGHQVAGTVLELSTPAGHRSQELKDSGEFTFDLVNGLPPESLLVLRRGKELLDLRHFPAPSYGRARDTSVVWEQPGAELEVLLAAGEGQHLECKQEIPDGESRKKMLKTIAAFAGQDGGTVLIGVQDDLQITGLPQGVNEDKAKLQVVSMIRDTVEPEPPCEVRIVEHEGKRVMAIEVSAGGQPHAYRNGSRLEFYVRRGPNTVPARHYEVAAGFRGPQSGPGRR